MIYTFVSNIKYFIHVPSTNIVEDRTNTSYESPYEGIGGVDEGGALHPGVNAK